MMQNKDYQEIQEKENNIIKKISNIVLCKNIIKRADLCDILRDIDNNTLYIRFTLIVDTQESRLNISSKLYDEFINQININKENSAFNYFDYKYYDIDFDIEYKNKILNIKN